MRSVSRRRDLSIFSFVAFQPPPATRPSPVGKPWSHWTKSWNAKKRIFCPQIQQNRTEQSPHTVQRHAGIHLKHFGFDKSLILLLWQLYRPFWDWDAVTQNENFTSGRDANPHLGFAWRRLLIGKFAATTNRKDVCVCLTPQTDYKPAHRVPCLSHPTPLSTDVCIYVTTDLSRSEVESGTAKLPHGALRSSSET